MSADNQSSTSSMQALTSNRALLIVGGIAIVALLAACGLGAFLLGSRLQDREATPPAATADGNGISEESAGVPTPFPVATGGPSVAQPVIVGVSDTGTFSVTLDVPATLSVVDRTYSVEPESIGADGLWAPEVNDENTALWVNGSVVNYVFGLADSEGNRTLLESLVPGDDISLTTRQGVTHAFSFESRAEVPASDRTVFSQQLPGVTLLLLGGEGETRLVVRGRYEVAAAAGNAGSNVVQQGETAQLGELQITPVATSYLANRPEAPPGFAFYLIDFTLQNVGLTAIDTANYRFVLSDELGNQYAINPIASRLGNYPPLGGFLNAGQSVTATAGYQIPAGLVSPTLTWTVANAQDGTQIQAILPFTAGGQTSQNAQVAVQDVTITPDLANLIITGQITNLTSQPLVVVREDITLRTTIGSDFLLLATNPAFPWTVPPNETLQFIVTFQRPFLDNAAVFTVLNQPFQLSGLQPQ